MRIYLDTCVLNRLLDPPLNEEIIKEAKLVELILKEVNEGNLELVDSDVLKKETQAIKEENRRFVLEGLRSRAKIYVLVDLNKVKRAEELLAQGVNRFDALHVACAETAADVFLTVDKRLLKRLKRINNLKVEALNPIDFWRRYAGSKQGR
jgi:predicted nucleic acid-binding protein